MRVLVREVKRVDLQFIHLKTVLITEVLFFPEFELNFFNYSFTIKNFNMKKQFHFSNLLRSFRYYLKLLRKKEYGRFSLHTILHKLHHLYLRLKEPFGKVTVKRALAVGFIAAGLIVNGQNLDFSSSPMLINPFNLSSSNSHVVNPVFVDLDNDGDLDVMHAGRGALGGGGSFFSGAFEYQENIGTSSSPDFATGILDPFGLQIPAAAFFPNGIIQVNADFADVDGDGDYDLLCIEKGRGVYYMENIGSATLPNFAPIVNLEFFFNGIVDGDWVDLDNDGDFDILLSDNDYTSSGSSGTFTAENNIFFKENIGNSTMQNYAPLVANTFGITTIPALNASGTRDLSSADFVDLDGDGDLDMFALQYDGGRSYIYFENVGNASNPSFGAPTSGSLLANNDPIYASNLVDIDGDGDLDLFYGDFSENVRFHENLFIDEMPLPGDEPCVAPAMPVAAANAGINSYSLFGTAINCLSSITLSNIDVTANGAIEASCGGVNGKSAWFTFTTPGCDNGSGMLPFEIEVSTDNAGTTVDTKVEVFASSDGSCDGTLTSLACNDDAAGSDACSVGPPGASTVVLVSASLEPATTYFVLVDVNDGASIGDYELSVQANLTAPVVGSSPSNKLSMTVPQADGFLYTYYWRNVANSGYSIKNTTSNSYEAIVLPGNTYQVQVMNRCSPTEFIRTPVTTYAMPGSEACSTAIDNLTCGASTENSITIEWNEVNDLYTNGGVLSGYMIFYRLVGSSGYSFVSNPSVSCIGGICNYTIAVAPGVDYEFWVRTRCSSNITLQSNVIICNTDALLTRAEMEEDVHSFVYNDVEYVDIKLSEDWGNFGIDIDQLASGSINMSKGKLSMQSGTTLLEVALSPNPSNGYTKLKVANAQGEVQYSLLDVTGATVLKGVLSESHEALISTDALQAGVYFVQVASATGITSAKLLVQ